MNILVTAIGSFSAECVIRILKQNSFKVIGCDIYPKEYHLEAYHCDNFYQAPLANDKERYIKFIRELCLTENIDIILPLTDVEIDVLNIHRKYFENDGIILAMQSDQTLRIARNKYLLHQEFKNDKLVKSIKTYTTSENANSLIYPIIAKPVNGRSSEGLYRINKKEELNLFKNKNNYIFQEFIDGPVITVDYVRNKNTGDFFAIPREELIRTKNGAGISVKVFNKPKLIEITDHICKKLNVNGCICVEYINRDKDYFLIDINPRFSAGIAFSCKAGYDMVTSHLHCFLSKDILPSVEYRDQIMVKHYNEETTSFL